MKKKKYQKPEIKDLTIEEAKKILMAINHKIMFRRAFALVGLSFCSNEITPEDCEIFHELNNYIKGENHDRKRRKTGSR